MSWTFNPPPGWPTQPPGWQPPPGWAPDPRWPPAPPDWQFWVPATPEPAPPEPAAPKPAAPEPPAATAAPPAYLTSPTTVVYSSAPPADTAAPADRPARPPWHQHWWAAGAGALAVLLVGCLGGTTVALVTNPDEPTAAPPPPTTSPDPDSTVPAPTPAPSGSGGPAAMERTGEGPAIVELDVPDGAVRTLTVTLTGTESYQLMLADEAGEPIGFLATGSGDYTGTHLIGDGYRTNETPAALDIVEANGGSWEVQLREIADAPVWPGQTTGTGSMVFRIDQAAVGDPITVSGTHDGESNFIVWALSDSEFGDSLLFNEIGEFSGRSVAEVTSGASILEIQADGAWTLSPG